MPNVPPQLSPPAVEGFIRRWPVRLLPVRRVLRWNDHSGDFVSHAPDPVFGWLNFSSADKCKRPFSARLLQRILHSEGTLIRRTELSPCSQSAWRTPTGAAADPFLTDRGRSGFRTRFVPDRERPGWPECASRVGRDRTCGSEPCDYQDERESADRDHSRSDAGHSR